MPAKRYSCTNYGVCERAVPGKYLEATDGNVAGCDDSNCSRYLSEVKGGAGGGAAGGGPRTKLLVGLAAGVVVVGLSLYLLMPSPPDPQRAEQLLSDYFPNLPK